tara:strand:- start:1550 stop:3529 length:1980 start_codon:yes stop_codon:yes gene_type:complete
MGADSVLVNAAFKEAISRGKANSINKKPLYDSINANMNKAFNTLNSIIDRYAVKKEANRAGVRKQMSGFQKTADELTQGMYAAKEPLPDAFINAFRDKIISLQEEFEDYNTYGKGDTSENNMARSRIMGELTRVKNQAINFRADSRIFLDRLKDVPPESVYGPNIPANQQALDFNNYKRLVEEGKIEVVYGEKGIEITSRGYNTRTIKVPLTNPSEQFLEAGSDNMMDAEESYGKDVVVTIGSLKSNFKATDLAHHSDIVKDINDYTKVGEDDAGKQNPQKSYDEEEAKEIFTRHVSTEEKFNNVVTSKIDGIHEIRSSFRVSLENNLNIPISVLQNMTYDADGDGVDDMDSLIAELDIDGGPNGEGDGIIDEKDIAAGENLANFEQNLDSLIDALTNVKHPAFDIGISAPMLGAYLEKINKGRYNTIYDRTVKANSRNTDGVNKKIGNSLITPDVWSDSYVPYIDFLENPVEGSRMQSPRGLDVIYQDGVFKKEVDGEWVEQSISDLASIDYIGKYVKGGNVASSTSTTVIPTGIGGSNEKGGAIAAPRHGGDPDLMLSTDTELVYKGGTTTMVDMFTGSTIDDGDVDDILSALYPTLNITTPAHLTEKIKINGREFKTDTIVAMDNVIAYLNSPEIQRLISKNANNTEFNSNKKVEE